MDILKIIHTYPLLTHVLFYKSIYLYHFAHIWIDQRLRNNKGEVVVFNSMVDAMNWMGARGWEFVQAYVLTVSNQNVYHWLLKKSTKKMSEEEREGLLEMFKTKQDFKNKDK